MNLDNVRRRLIAIIIVTVNLLSCNEGALAMEKKVVNLGGDGEGFGLIHLGGHGYGSNSLGVWLSGNIRIGLSDTIGDEFNGVGIVDARISADDVRQAKDIHDQLCKAAENGPANEIHPVEPASIYYVDCLQGTKLADYSGKTYDLPAELFSSIHRFYKRMKNAYVPEARNIVRLEGCVAQVEQKKDNLLISVKFINQGYYPISIRRPDYLKATEGDRLDVQAAGADGKILWETKLAGRRLVNESEVTGKSLTTPMGEIVTYVEVPARSSVIFTFLVAPDAKIPHGIYSFNLVAYMDASAPDVAPSLGFVDFHSDYKNPTKVTLDRDYPSTPEEWKDYESRKAKTVSPVPSGASITEPGYYRAASGFGTSALLKSFKADEQAPDAPADIQFAKWHWVADLARAVTCAPGEACPRDGRWLLCSRGRYYGNPDQSYPQHERHMRAGEVSPLVSVAHVNDRDLYWTWQGA